jgi:hypothetical protein
MTKCSTLYNLYADKNICITAEEAQIKLTPYAQQFNITLSNDEIILGSDRISLGVLKIKSVCAIVDEPECIYIILNGCIYALYKATSEIKVDIRD